MSRSCKLHGTRTFKTRWSHVKTGGALAGVAIQLRQEIGYNVQSHHAFLYTTSGLLDFMALTLATVKR